MEKKITLFASETQFKAIKCFFGDKVEDILYGGAARGGKSETIGMILAICIAAFPGSAWLLARTVLADLKATTLSTFFTVIARFGYGKESYKDKIRDERHLLFQNLSKLFVIQVNLEPGDIEFDRIGSYGYTGGFLDEAQQMSNKVREVLSGRLSELDGSFQTEVEMKYKDLPIEELNPGFEVEFKIVGQTCRTAEECTLKEEDIIEEIIDGGKILYIIRIETLRIPYRVMKSEVVKNKLIHTYAWHFKGCTFSGCNPGTNFTRTEFYKPWKQGALPSYMAFFPAKVGDNPWVDPKYVERLQRLPESSIRKQRLLYGNFDFDDNPGILYDQDTIEKMYTRIYEGDKTPFVTVDAARQGKDSTEIGIWKGLHLKEIIKIDKGKLTTQGEFIEKQLIKHGVHIDNTIVDEVGVGGGLVDILGCKGFIGNSQPLHPYAARNKNYTYKKRNYLNLRTQAFYYLQKYMEFITITVPVDKQDAITEELLTVKEKDVANDSKLQIIKKAEMKEELGRSPDLADMVSMRMRWIIKGHHYGEEDELDTKVQTKEETNETFMEGLINQLEEEKVVKQFSPDFDIYD